MDKKSRVLIVGGTGYIGKRIVKASIQLGHPTYILFRPEVVSNIDKVQMLLSFKQLGAKLVEASLDDHQRLVDALKRVDVVISALAGGVLSHHILEQLKLLEAIKEAGNIKASLDDHQRLVDALKQVDVVISALAGGVLSHHILEQLKLVEAIKEAGNIKRFLPSEFGMDPDVMEHALQPGNITFIDKRKVRRAIEAASIPHTYVSSNMFAGYFAGSLAQYSGSMMPPKDKALIYGDGNVKGVWLDEDDVGIYTIKSIDDLRTLNKTMYIRPPMNILSQKEVIEIWERLSGRSLDKICISSQDYLTDMEGKSYEEKIVRCHLYQIFFRGDLYNFEIGPNATEATKLYPEVKYTTMDSYMERYV